MKILTELFFTDNLAFAIQGLLCFQVHFNIFSLFFLKKGIGLLIQIALNL